MGQREDLPRRFEAVGRRRASREDAKAAAATVPPLPPARSDGSWSRQGEDVCCFVE